MHIVPFVLLEYHSFLLFICITVFLNFALPKYHSFVCRWPPTQHQKILGTQRPYFPLVSGNDPAGNNRELTDLGLVTDGGGVRGYSSLLILEALMKQISRLERDERPEATSSANPLQHRFVGPTSASQTPDGSVPPPGSLSQYLVSHYFDYIAGTSTGG